MKKNVAEKYFNQKNWTVIELICVIVAVIFSIVAMIVDGGGPIGFTMVAISIIVFIAYRSSKIRDNEIDQLLNGIIEAKVDTKGSKQISNTYDLKADKIKKGKDGNIRSSHYIIAVFSMESCSTEINVYDIDLISQEVKNKSYSIPKSEPVLLTEEIIKTGNEKRTVKFIESKAQNLLLPVDTSDFNTSKVIEQICSGTK